MTHAENRALSRSAAILLAAAVARYAWESRHPPALFPPDSAGVLPALLEESREAAERERRRREPLAEGERVDPNRAPEVELDRLPGIGPSVAAAIVAEREAGRPFHRPEDLERVRGIGPATLERLRPHLDLDEPPPGVPVATRPDGPRALAGPDPRVDLNRAGEAELTRLPGIGPALARRIVESRSAAGPFRSPDDLLRVRGIGPAAVERLRPLVRMGGPVAPGGGGEA